LIQSPFTRPPNSTTAQNSPKSTIHTQTLSPTHKFKNSHLQSSTKNQLTFLGMGHKKRQKQKHFNKNQRTQIAPQKKAIDCENVDKNRKNAKIGKITC
jgi:hypothetical protein